MPKGFTIRRGSGQDSPGDIGPVEVGEGAGAPQAARVRHSGLGAVRPLRHCKSKGNEKGVNKMKGVTKINNHKTTHTRLIKRGSGRRRGQEAR